MKTIVTLGWIVLCMALVGCDTKTEKEKSLDRYVQGREDKEAAWQALQDASQARVDQLEEEMSYEEVVDIFDDKGVQKMSAKMGDVERTIVEWTLDGDIFVKATFNDGILTKWDTN